MNDFGLSDLEMKRNQNLNKVNHQDALKKNHVALHPQNTKEHEKRKWEECWKLRQKGKHFVTEARFKDRDGIRADIYVLDDDRMIEIETSSYELEERKEKYPEDTEFILLEEED